MNLIVLLAVLLIPLNAVTSVAGQIRVFVGEMNATGGQNRDEMKATLQTLLSSRLNTDRIITVGSAAEADAVVSGTYTAVGKMFSIDTIAKTPSGKTATRAFVQGETQDELIPAVGKLADKLTSELMKVFPGGQPEGHVPQPTVANSPVTAAAQPSGEFVKPRSLEPGAAAGWLSKRLAGAANLLAGGMTLADGSREIFMAEDQRIAYYHLGSDLKLVAEAELKSTDKIISLDTVANGDGTLDLYVTIINAGELASQVWQAKGDKLQLVAEKLPYFFRSMGISGGVKKLYAQAMGRGDDFYGDVAEATRSGSTITLNNPLKMPRYGTIYSFNQFRDGEGKILTVVVNPDGYLIVYDQQLSELWRSNDKFGGSELYFQKEDMGNFRTTGDKNRWIFMNQRIQVSSKGEVLVGKNDGFWVMGNARSYKRGAIYCLAWNGSGLDEKWHTRETQNYMPDYLLDDSRNELLILQTVQRPGIFSRGASSLSIKKIE